MALESLLERPQLEVSHPNITDDIGANLEALRLSGLVFDGNREAVEIDLKADREFLHASGIYGEFLAAVPQEQLPLSHRVSVLDIAMKAKIGKDHPGTYVDHALWSPATSEGSYSEEELSLLGPEYDGKKWVAHGRIIVPNTENPDEPILHHLNKPFDRKYSEEGEVTQVEALALQKAGFEVVNPNLNLNPLTARDISLLALVRLVKGDKPMPMEWGFMRDATLSRTEVHGGSVVGSVSSVGGPLGLDRSLGSAYPSVGVGVSVGPKNPKLLGL
jgi:hypothetical protein